MITTILLCCLILLGYIVTYRNHNDAMKYFNGASIMMIGIMLLLTHIFLLFRQADKYNEVVLMPEGRAKTERIEILKKENKTFFFGQYVDDRIELLK